MSKHDSKDEPFGPLLADITAAEAGLRARFEATPGPAPEALARIKSRLRAEVHPHRRVWPLWASTVAASIILAVGTGLYYHAQLDPLAQESPTESRRVTADASLEAFAASLPAVLSDEDPAISQLSNDLKEMESQTSTVWSNG